ncbi:MAG: Flp family type IVb pilin [Desulfuromonadaceae bacterium]|nr:Flp family type IVb pilin [Desulfuromonadaceae bacterium]
MKKLTAEIVQLVKNEKGQGLVEYALILMLIAMVVIVALQLFGVKLNNTYENISSGVTSAGFK